MGQYFRVVNLSKGEYFKPNMLKAVELCSDKTGNLLAYLLLKGPQDGTSFLYQNADPDEVTQEDRENERYQDIVTEETKEDGVIAQLKESRKKISEANEYAGRWAGDRIVIAGDYAEPHELVPDDMEEELYEKMLEDQEERDIDEEIAEEYAESNCNVHSLAVEFFDNITSEARREFSEFMGEDFDPNETGVMRPDMLIQAK